MELAEGFDLRFSNQSAGLNSGIGARRQREAAMAEGEADIVSHDRQIEESRRPEFPLPPAGDRSGESLPGSGTASPRLGGRPASEGANGPQKHEDAAHSYGYGHRPASQGFSEFRAKEAREDKEPSSPQRHRGASDPEELAQRYTQEPGGEVGGEARSGKESTGGEQPGTALSKPQFTPRDGLRIGEASKSWQLEQRPTQAPGGNVEQGVTEPDAKKASQECGDPGKSSCGGKDRGGDGGQVFLHEGRGTQGGSDANPAGAGAQPSQGFRAEQGGGVHREPSPVLAWVRRWASVEGAMPNPSAIRIPCRRAMIAISAKWWMP